MIKRMYIKLNLLVLISIISLVFIDEVEAKILLLKTEGIIAYDYVVKGINQACQEQIIIYNIKKNLGNNEEVKNQIKNIKSRVAIVLGDEAAEFASINLKGMNVLYSMVLEPEKYNFNKKTSLGLDILINIDQSINYLKEIKQGIKKVGVIYNLEENERMLKYIEKVAEKNQIKLLAKGMNNEQEIVSIVNELLVEAEAIIVMPSLITTKAEVSQYISQESLKKGVPVAGLAEIFLQNGALFTVSINPIIVGRVLGQSACLIIKGNEIINLRITSPSYSVISVNLKLAELLNLKFPKVIIDNAYKIIK